MNTLESILSRLDARAPSNDLQDELARAAKAAKTSAFLLRSVDTVDLTSDRGIPLVAFTASRTDEELRLQSVGVLVATRLEDNRTLADTWHVWKEPVRRSPDAPPPDEEEEPAIVGFASELHRNDLRARLPDLLWRPGHLIVRAIVGDAVTPPVTIALTGGGLDRDPDVRAYLDWVASQQPPMAAQPPSPIAMDYHRDEWTPEAPAKPGLSLVLQPVSLAREGDSLALRGSYNLPVAPHEKLPLGPHATIDSEGRTVVARVTISLLLVGHESPEVTVIPLRIDARAFTPTEIDGRSHVAGLFRCDLFQHPDMPRVLQRYSVYAFANEHMAGPLPLTLVSEDLVPVISRL